MTKYLPIDGFFFISQAIIIMVIERKFLKKQTHYFIYNISGAMQQENQPQN